MNFKMGSFINSGLKGTVIDGHISCGSMFQSTLLLPFGVIKGYEFSHIKLVLSDKIFI